MSGLGYGAFVGLEAEFGALVERTLEGWALGHLTDLEACRVAISLLDHEDARAHAHGDRLLDELCARKVPHALYCAGVRMLDGECAGPEVGEGFARLLEVYHSGQPDRALHGQVCASLGLFSGSDRARALHYFTEGAECGNAMACYVAGKIYAGMEHGFAQEQDTARAVHYLEQAVGQGLTPAYSLLGVLHLGDAIPDADGHRGVALLREAERRGDALARKALASYRQMVGTPPQIDPQNLPGEVCFSLFDPLCGSLLPSDHADALRLSAALLDEPAEGLPDEAAERDRTLSVYLYNRLSCARSAGCLSNAMFEVLLTLASTPGGRTELLRQIEASSCTGS